ncbi:MAG: TetR/AcrR family transcriptional regulator [Chitinophagales bacterium]
MKLDKATISFMKLSSEKQNRIMEAAITEFAEYGYNSANINKIAQNAGVSIGSMYKYFNSKEDLYLTIVHLGVETLKATLEDIVNREADLFTRIEMILQAIQSYSRQYVGLTRLYNEMTTENHSELTWTIVSDMEGITAELYSSFIKGAQVSGQLRPDIDPRYFAFFLDNLFILLQFSYACEYYKNRLKMFIGQEVFDQDELMVDQLMKFIRGAFGLQ